MHAQQKDLLRFFTAGSVDDGKSTLIGRLLYDSNQLYKDHLDSLIRDSAKNGGGPGELDFSLLLDGLKAEREQNITIDVAYRYFSTKRRNFIVADTPGHEQYTPNMATGSSTAHLLVLLINAKNGIVPQTRRHSFIAALMGIKHFVVVINKMDLVDYSQSLFEEIKREYTEFSARLSVHDICFIPISATQGDNVVMPSKNMPWFHGKPLIVHLEEVHIAGDRNLIDLRFPVQLTLRPHQDFRGYAGTVASGIVRKGDTVVALPSGQKSRIKAIYNYKEELAEAFASQAVTLQLDSEIDVGRGDMLVHERNQPKTRSHLEAMLIWMDPKTKAAPGTSYLLKHSTKTVPTRLYEIIYKIDINTLHRQKEKDHRQLLAFNEIGRVKLMLHHPIFADTYEVNRSTGSFILIDSLSNQTLAAGIIIDRESSSDAADSIATIQSQNLTRTKSLVSREDRERLLNQKGCVVWLTGLSGSGKTTIAHALEKRLLETGYLPYVLDGDNIRQGLNKDLGFSPKDRAENVRRIGEVAALFAQAGLIAIVSLISPYQKDRDAARHIEPEGRFLEIYLNPCYETCELRDPKGLYKKAKKGEILDFTGVNAPYEPPLNPELTIDTGNVSLDAAVEQILIRIKDSLKTN